MTRSRVVSVSAVVALAVAGLAALAPAAHGAAPTCRDGAVDFDQNGGTDVAIGAAGTPVNNDDLDSHGVVDVRMRFGASTRAVLIPNPDSTTVDRFGESVAELDLSGNTGRQDLCSVLAVSASDGFPPSGCHECPGYGSRMFLYRWDAATSNFVQLAVILAEDVFTDGGSSRLELAAQSMGSTMPADRDPVLWIGAPLGGHLNDDYNGGEVARLVLTGDGSVASKQVFAPGATRTAEMPLDDADSGSFGASIQGTPSADQVIVGAPDSAVSGRPNAGAVVVLNRGSTSQLITEDTVGVPGTAEFNDRFGSALWLSTQASDAARAPTSLLIGAPQESIGALKGAGAAAQVRYDRSVTPAVVRTSGARYWSQDSAGVAGKPETDDHFGSSFESLTTHGPGAPRFLVGTPGEDLSGHADAGAVYVLGDGRAYDEASGTGVTLSTGAAYGAVLGGARDIDDYDVTDPVAVPAVGEWSRYVIVAAPGDHALAFGLKAGTVHSSRLLQPPGFCRETGSHPRCPRALSLTGSGGG